MNYTPVRYDKVTNTYRGLQINWNNIQEFQIFFLEAQYKLFEAMYLEEVNTETGHSGRTMRAKIEKKRQQAKEELEETYKIIWSIRKQVFDLYSLSKEYKKAIDERSKEDFIFWINSFAWTYDPRLTNVGIPASLPLVLFPGQVEILTQIDFNYRNNKPMIVEKSRAEGLTEMLCAYDVWHFIYTPGYKGGWGSRLKDLVDKSGNPDSIFERIRRIFYTLPEEMRPKGMKSRNNKWDNTMRIANPVNGASLVGEGGDNIGRGGRSSFYKVDEKATIEHQELADMALSQNTNCQCDISTPNGMNHFYQKKTSGKCDVITCWWWMNPSKNIEWRKRKRPDHSAWYEFMKLRNDDVTVAQEIDINYKASVGGVMIPSEWIMAAVDYNLPDIGDSISGFDIAAGGSDKSVYVHRKGSVCKRLKEIPQKTPMEATWQVVEECNKDNTEVLCYDKNTFGEDVYPQLTQTERRISFRLSGIYGQSSPTETFLEDEGVRASEKFQNLRAELWWNLRKRFEKTYLHRQGKQIFPVDEMISIPSHTTLIEELGTPLLLHTTNGKIALESKKAMKARGVKSPNYGDALAYSFSTSKGKFVADHFNYWNSDNVKVLTLSESAADEMAVSFVLGENNILYVIISQYFYHSGRVNILYEESFEHFLMSDIKKFITDHVNRVSPPNYWIGNEKLFEGINEGKATLWYDFKKNGMPIKQNFRLDIPKSMLLIDRLFDARKLCINESCTSLINQLRNWQVKDGKPQKNLYFCDALIQLIQVLVKNRLIDE